MEYTRNQICCFTGHRPAKLPWGYNEQDPLCRALRRTIRFELADLYDMGYRVFITGMALGVDQICAEQALALRAARPGVEVWAAVPCRDQANRWRGEQRERWQHILDQCDRVDVLQERYDSGCMLRRDAYMVDRSSMVLAVFDGSGGGTRYTLDEAAGKGLAIWILDPRRPDRRAVRLVLSLE